MYADILTEGAFLIPYFLMMIFGAVPLFFMELALGQFHRTGSISVWKIAPIFKGIGMAQCLISYYVAFYYNVIIAWALYYLIASFSRVLPWTRCDNDWNTDRCYTSINISSTANGTSATAEYFERAVLGLDSDSGIGQLGAPRGKLALCLVGVFIMLYFSLWKGVKSSGKVVWVTATMPYVVLSVLLVRGITLPGAMEGILYFITPRVDRLGDPSVWIDAAVQIFFSVGAGFGAHIAYASYNKFHNNCHRDCILTACINSATSIFSGFVIFSYLGFMAKRANVQIDKVATWGPGLVFVVYPEAISVLPGSVVWSVIFFFMLITLGLDSAMGGLEAVLTAIKDEYSWLIKRHRYGREILTAIVCGTSFMFALQNITNAGIYMLTLWDTFAAGTAILFVVFWQAVAVGWVYGLEQFCTDIEQMTGFRPYWYWRICWKFVSPLFLFIVIVSSIASYKPLIYPSYTVGNYIYPPWANAVGWLIAASSMVFVPIVAIWKLSRTPGAWSQSIALNISPHWEHRSIKTGDKKVKRFQRKHWLSI
ncbi:Sodium-dependent dopamine transporter [Lamellibrachia satsuma]|nr:Sodium-dependent dopamine transporter [Lamellibrachia satsuma]